VKGQCAEFMRCDTQIHALAQCFPVPDLQSRVTSTTTTLRIRLNGKPGNIPTLEGSGIVRGRRGSASRSYLDDPGRYTLTLRALP
jgi:hypothetical protein